jgi:hypothetical protein
MVSQLPGLLAAPYDLSYRPRVGHTSYYRLDIVYRLLDTGGRVERRDHDRGDFRRVVEAVRADGRVEETVTWRNARRRVAEGDGPYGPPENLAYLDGFSYRFSAEESYEEFHWDFGSFPRDLGGYFSLLLVIDAHFEFDFLRSVHHGSIDRLRRVGDAVVPPDSDRPFDIMFPPNRLIPGFTRRDMRTTFAGLSTSGAEPCARLAFSMGMTPFEVITPGGRAQCSTRFAGTITSRLSDGALEHGEFTEWVFNQHGRGVCNSPVYEIRRIDRARYETGEG